MEYRSIIYNAARDGNLRRLRVFLEGRGPLELASLLGCGSGGSGPGAASGASGAGSTPALVVAARNGHRGVVAYLVEKGAEVGAVGTVAFDGETIEGAPALWAAAAAGHEDIVELLVGAGADVNQRTATNSTPLRGACFDGHLGIVRFLLAHGADSELANRHGHTCLMIAAFRRQPHVLRALIAHGADVNKASLKGNTALHDAAETGSLEMLEILLEAGALMRKDAYGLSPLISAASLGHSEVLEFLLDHPQCFWREKVEALALAGATCVDKRRDLSAAVGYWRRGLGLLEAGPPAGEQREAWHWADSTAEDHLPQAAYGNQREMRSLQDLEEKAGEPDQLRMQALLIRERVLGPGHADTVYYLRYRGAIYADVGRFDRCVQLWMHALRMQQRAMEPLCTMTQGTIVSFAELFAYMLSDASGQGGGAERGSEVAFADIHAVVEITVEEMRRGLEEGWEAGEGSESHRHGARERGEALQRLSVALLHLLCLATSERRGRGAALSVEERAGLGASVYRAVRLAARDERGRSLLHLACEAETSSMGRFPVARFPSEAVVELLVEAGAEVCAVDEAGRAPLHALLHAAQSGTETAVEGAAGALEVLLRAGAHVDQRAKDGSTPLSLLPAALRPAVRPLRHLSLACLAASAVRAHRLPTPHALPPNLHSFLLRH